MFGFFKADLDVIRDEATYFLTKNLGLTKPTAKNVSMSIDKKAADYLLQISPKTDMVSKYVRKIIAAKLACLMHREQESEIIKAIAIDIEHVLSVEIPMAMAQGQLSPDVMSSSAVLSGLVEAYALENS